MVEPEKGSVIFEARGLKASSALRDGLWIAARTALFLEDEVGCTLAPWGRGGRLADDGTKGSSVALSLRAITPPMVGMDSFVCVTPAVEFFGFLGVAIT